MTDESFHLTPLDIRRYDFGSKAFRGFDAQKVEDFRNQVADELERLTKLNGELDAKAKGFHEQLRAFRERDKALNDALVSAQQLRAEMREQADREAQLILREARAEAERLVDAAKGEVRRLESELVGARQVARDVHRAIARGDRAAAGRTRRAPRAAGRAATGAAAPAQRGADRPHAPPGTRCGPPAASAASAQAPRARQRPTHAAT